MFRIVADIPILRTPADPMEGGCRVEKAVS